MFEYFDMSEHELRIGGIPVQSLIDEFGTPLYAYDLGIVERKYRKVKQAFPDFDIFYSVKANGSLGVSSWLAHLGAGAEIASDGELYLMINAGFPPDRIIFAGPAKTEDELAMAIRAGIYSINAESITELERIERISRDMGVRTRVSLRVNSGVGVDDAPERMVGGSSKFGFDEEDLVAEVTSVESRYIDFVGFHLYTASDVLSEDDLLANFERTLEIAGRLGSELGIRLEVVDFGGGFGVPSKPGQKELDPESLGRKVSKILNEPGCPVKPGETRLIWELGRYLVSECGVYISKVVDIKESRGKSYLLLDGGMNQFVRPVFMGVNHPVKVLNRIGEAPGITVDIGGPTCTPIDMLARDCELPRVSIGDPIGFFNAGAYGFTMSMLYFLGHPLPAEVVILNGEAVLARRRGEVGDCMINQLPVEMALWGRPESKPSSSAL